MICKRITIKGRVQGVYFRASAQDKAEELGVTGEVRNLADGNVEVIACGTVEQVQQLAGWCHVGPPRARVEQVILEDAPMKEYEGFRIVRR
ncbi:MAG TPA: acylphosphatase [Chitinophagaceae bacterium]|nr:acylphosphatase [Chitinophagaceae bacterium]